jgi:hypothetical protein
MDLRWSNSDPVKPEIYADRISPKIGKYCDLVCISEPTNPRLMPLPGMVGGQVTLDLWVEVFPSNQSHRAPPGEYDWRLAPLGVTANR